MESHYPSEDIYKKLVNGSFEMFCTANQNGFFEYINPSFTKVLGYPQEVLVSTSFYEFIHPEDIERTKLECQKLIDGNDTVKFENRYRHIHGHYLTFSWSGSYDRDKQLIFAVAHDVTEIKKAQNISLQIEKALYKETILAKTDSNGVIIEVNDKFCQISGYSKQELIGKTHKLVNSGHHPKSFFKSMWQTISSGNTWTGVIKNVSKSGQFYFVQSVLTPIFDADGNIVNYLAIRQDITDSIVNQAKLTKTLEILNETNSIANVGGWELDIETGDLTWTEETFKILEVEQRVDSKPILEEGIKLFTPEYIPVIENAVNRAIQYGESYSLELQALTAKGNVVWVYTNGKPNYKDGKIVSLSGTIQNIDLRKSAEIKYAKERQKSAQNAKFASLGELSASVAHEINNPLGIISGTAELVARPNFKLEKLATKMDVIHKSADRISHIVKSLRKFSRTDEVNIKNAYSISQIIEEAITLTQPKLQRELVELNYTDSSNAMVLCNEIEIEQVMINLINNAIDAVQGLVDKWIKIIVQDIGSLIQLEIIDSGSGIPESIQPRIFDPFYTTKNVGEGTGLGLSIIKGILDDHQANISINNDSTHTCFIIQFPKHGG